MENPTFEFEKQRDFGSVIGDSLFFFTRNFKSFLLGFLTYIGPFFLIGAFGMIYAGMAFPDMFDPQFSGTGVFLGLLVFIPFIVFASIMMVAFVCAMVKKYQRQKTGPLAEGIWPDVKRNLQPTFVAFLTLFFILVIPYVLLGVLAFFAGGEIAIAILMLISIPFVIYLTVPITIFMAVHVLEKNSISASLKRAFYLVREKWWVTFGIYIVISILASIASYIFMLPAYIVFMAKTLGSVSTGEISPEFGLWFGIMYACGFLGSLFTGMYQLLGVILQYYSLREQKEGTGLLKRIQNIDQSHEEAMG